MDSSRFPDGAVHDPPADPVPPEGVPQNATAGERLAADALEIVEALRHLASAKLDRARLKARRMVTTVGLVAAGGVVALALLVVLVLTTVRGLSGAVAHLFGDRAWAGDLTVGAGGLGVIALAGWAAIRTIEIRARRRTVTKYESRKLKQRYAFGQDVDEASNAAERDRQDGSLN